MNILLVIFAIFAIILFIQKRKLSQQITILTDEALLTKSQNDLGNASLKNKISELELKNEQLSRYQTILDADAKAREIIDLAHVSAESLITTAKQEAEYLLSKANSELQSATGASAEIRSKTNIEVKELKWRAENTMQNATTEAGKIIQSAHKRAEEIAGEAYEALKKADGLEKTAKAMKNVIEGYGDQYLIPSFALLDHLAEEYSHTQAGEELKNCRERMRLMIKSGTAAKCDYVEANRRYTAISFVLDAFNGKVDSVISTLKHENHGILSQKIKDAFYVVNNNGKAFRNAVVTQEFLQIRLEEFKWAATVIELKWKEREEQRQIKDQIREEEKARRDFEKALKDAAKEEELLKKAIEKAQKEVANATEQQKAKYEEQLKELNARLVLAEEKSQRAISMAQQTKTGHVYVISNIGSFGENVYKVGMTRRLEPLDRIYELGNASVPFEFDVHAMILSEDAPSLERELHKKFLRMQLNKVNPRKEFFKVSLDEIRTEIESLGIVVKWTIAAEARHYRESLAIEKSIKDSPLNQDNWVKKQLEKLPTEKDILLEEMAEESI